MSDNIQTKHVSILTLTIYSIIFYSAWTVFHFVLEPIISAIPNEFLSGLLSDGIIKNLVWTLPAVILIARNKDKLLVNMQDMLKPNKSTIKYLWIFPAFLAYIILGIVVKGGKIAVSQDFSIAEIITVIFVGITEEFVFRGWLLNATVKRNENIAIAVNAVMFLAIHFPRWIAEGNFIHNFASLGFVSIIALSVIFSLVFLKTKNIVLPILLHSFWDLIIFMLY